MNDIMTAMTPILSFIRLHTPNNNNFISKLLRMRKLFLILMTLMACTWSLSAQTRTYHGTVIDATTNEPLIGATVMPVGGGRGTATDIDGKFTITLPQDVNKIQVSYVGMKTETVTVTDGMVIKLTTVDTSLDDVVVMGYGSSKNSVP